MNPDDIAGAARAQERVHAYISAFGEWEAATERVLAAAAGRTPELRTGMVRAAAEAMRQRLDALVTFEVLTHQLTDIKEGPDAAC